MLQLVFTIVITFVFEYNCELIQLIIEIQLHYDLFCLTVTIVISGFPFVHFSNITIVISRTLLSGKKNVVKMMVPENGFEVTEWINASPG